ncbi:hypothetical protein ACXYRO_01435 [Mycoplasma sp. 4013]
MNKKTRNWWVLGFNIYFVAIIIFIVIFSGKVVPWRIITNFVVPGWALIVLSTLVTIFTLIPVFLLIFYKKYKAYHFQYLVMVLGLSLTIAWVPSAYNENKDLQWSLYQYDTIPVFFIYVLFYFFASYYINPKNIEKLRNKYLNKQKKTS